MAIIPGDRRRMLDVMITGLSMERIFYSPDLMSLLKQPIPTTDIYRFRAEPPRRPGYSQSHLRKIERERKRRQPVTIRLSRQLFVEQQTADQVDAMRYAFEVQQFAGAYWDSPGTNSAARKPCESFRSLTFADIDRAVNMCRSISDQVPRYDLYWHQLGNGRVYELPELDPMTEKAMGLDGRRVLVVPKDAIDDWFRMLTDEVSTCDCSRGSRGRPAKLLFKLPLKLRAPIRLNDVCRSKRRYSRRVLILQRYPAPNRIRELYHAAATRQERHSFVGCAHLCGEVCGVRVDLGVGHECSAV